MQLLPKIIQLGVAALAAVVLLAGAPPNSAFAQATPAPSAVVSSEATIKALQEALNKQGIAVKVDGALTDETRAAIRKYQSQHHLAVTGEPDKATLDKLGVAARLNATPTQPSALAQATPTPNSTPAPAPGQVVPGPTAPRGAMMNCPMMQSMPEMMQMMQGMMQMMQTMQAMQPAQMPMQSSQMPMRSQQMPMQSQQMPTAQTQPAQTQSMQAMMGGMMQMMQGMMQMMQSMQPSQMPMQPRAQ